MRPITDILLVSMVLVLFAGCFTDPLLEEPQFDLPPEGTVATYGSDEGVVLTVEIGGTTSMRDPWGFQHLAGMLHYRLDPVDPAHDFIEMTEYVSLDSGAIIRHDTHCSGSGYRQGNCPPPEIQMNFVMHGLPGGLGLAPMWLTGAEMPEGSKGFQPQPVEDRRWAPAEGEPGCWSREPVGNTPWKSFGAWLPVTVVSRPLLVCPDIALPVAFYPDMGYPGDFADVHGERLRLVELQHGTGSLWSREGRSPWMAPDLPAPIPPNNSALIGDESPFVAFTSQEAHVQLLKMSEDYSRAVDDGAIVWMSYEESVTTGWLMDRKLHETHEWTVALVHGVEFSSFKIAKTEWLAPGGETVNSSYELAEGWKSPDPPVTPVPAPAVDLSEVFGMAASLFGCRDDPGATISNSIDEGRASGEWQGRLNERMVIRVFVDPPTPDGGISIMRPWTIEVDGLSGKVILINADQDVRERFDLEGLQALSACPQR